MVAFWAGVASFGNVHSYSVIKFEIMSGGKS